MKPQPNPILDFQSSSLRRLKIMGLAVLCLLLLVLSSRLVIGARAVAPAATGLGTEAASETDTGASARITASTTITTTRYEITDLGVLTNQLESGATAINSQGQVVGLSGSDPFLWLPAPAYGLPAGIHNLQNIDPDAVSVRGINDSGLLIGQGQGGNIPTTWQWQPASQAWQTSALPTLQGSGMALGVNNDGHVVGSVRNNAGGNEGVLWQNGALTALTTLGGEGYAINDFGVMAGMAEDIHGDAMATRWTAPGSPVNLGFLPGGSESYATDINDWGEVVGNSYPGSFIWLPGPAYGLDAGMHALAPLADSSLASGINNLAQVVGSTYYSSLGVYTPFIWQNGTTFDLNSLIDPASGWTLTQASDINDAGQITGSGIFNGSNHAVLLTPRKWTLLFYIAGDDLTLGDDYYWIFQQLEAAANVPGVTVLVAWDNTLQDDSAYYVIQHDTDLANSVNYVEGETGFSKGELVMSQSPNLSDFITWGITNYPSDHVALILDDHGSGLGGGLCDGGCSSNKMTLADMQLALDVAQTQTGKKIDVMFAAMCLMGMLEDAYQFQGYADYYVANEDVMWGYMEPYLGYVQGITPLSTPEEVAVNFAVSYADVMTMTTQSHTISVLDMSQLDPLVTATNSLAAQLDLNQPQVTGTLTTIAQLVQRFDNESPSGITTADTYVDLYDFASLVSQNLAAYPAIVAAAEDVKTAVSSAVIYESHKSSASTLVGDSHGVSIFFPATASSFYNPTNYAFAVGANWGGNHRQAPSAADTWAGMLGGYFALVQPNGPDDPNPPEPVEKLAGASFELYLPLLKR